MSQARHCWCGNEALEAFSPEYLLCAACQTLVAAQMPDPKDLLPTEGEQGFYGRQYYESYLTGELELPSLSERARTDLAERCLHWLRALLKYKLPPAKVLELGSAHGGFVALMRWAGYEATGLEVSPWLVDFARESFGAPMLLGPVERQELEPQSLDAVLLLDLAEHLPDPAGTIRHCLRLLKPDGILLIQTPRYREGRSHERMVAEDDPFLKMLTAPQHLYLFSRQSIQRLLGGLGAGQVEFEPAIFAAYDMFLAASRMPLPAVPQPEIQQALGAAPSARLVRALLDVDERWGELARRHTDSEADRAARLEVIHWQGRQLAELDAARAELGAQLARLHEQYAVVEADRAARLEVIHLQGRQVAELDTQLAQLQERAEADRALKLELTESLRQRLEETERERNGIAAQSEVLREQFWASEAERKATAERLEGVEQALAESEADREARQAGIQELQRLLAESEADRAARLASIQELHGWLAKSEADRAELARQWTAAQEEAHTLRGRLAVLQTLLGRLRLSYVYRAMRRSGLWGWLEPVRERTAAPVDPASRLAPDPARQLRLLLVDLTPVLPGGENGGAKPLTIELLRQLSRLAPDCQFVLLTSTRAHEELAVLDAPNVRRLCVSTLAAGATPAARRLAGLALRLSRRLPAPAARLVEAALPHWEPRGSLPRELGADLLFCPFTAPLYSDPTVPVVSMVLDLQYLYYPQFFAPAERGARDRHFRQACGVASRLICISDHVRRTVLENTDLKPERVQTIHISSLDRLERLPAVDADQVLSRHGLEANRFLLYPANFWAHKNHEMLLTAFGMYAAQRPGSALKLVLTGAPGPRMEFLRGAARQMGLGARVVFAGFLPGPEFAALMRSCLALIFPSLYEGFGMPVLEALAAGKPALCSHLTSLPEVAGEAALYFDPRKPAEIVAAIEHLEGDPECVRALAELGRQRVAGFGDAAAMAARYLEVFRDVVRSPAGFVPGVHGVYPDGWAGERVAITYDPGPEGRKIAVEIQAPHWIPAEAISIRVLPDVGGAPQFHRVRRSERLTIERVIPSQGGFIELLSRPLFQPKACGRGQDKRWLGCRVLTASIVEPDGAAARLFTKDHD
ncbi:MAG: glycosyltransferase [Acidobacteriota bacterium]